MKYINLTKIIFYIFVLILVSCRNDNKNIKEDISNSKQINKIKNNKSKNQFLPDNIVKKNEATEYLFDTLDPVFNVMDKMKSDSIINNEDYFIICDFILNNKHECMSEAVYGFLFEYFYKKKEHNYSFLSYLNSNRKKSTIDSIFIELISSHTCIDISGIEGINNYTYNQLITDFPMYLGNDAGKIEFLNRWEDLIIEINGNYNDPPLYSLVILKKHGNHKIYTKQSIGSKVKYEFLYDTLNETYFILFLHEVSGEWAKVSAYSPIQIYEQKGWIQLSKIGIYSPEYVDLLELADESSSTIRINAKNTILYNIIDYKSGWLKVSCSNGKEKYVGWLPPHNQYTYP